MSYSDLYGTSSLSADSVESPNATIVNLTVATLNSYDSNNITVNNNLVCPATNNFIGNLSGNLTGNGTGIWTGSVIGSVTGSANVFTAPLIGDIVGFQDNTRIADGVIIDSDINESAAIVDTKLATISTAGKVSNSATTATSENTADSIIMRDASGNFIAHEVTANIIGNCSGSAATFTDSLAGDIIVTMDATQIASG